MCQNNKILRNKFKQGMKELYTEYYIYGKNMETQINVKDSHAHRWEEFILLNHLYYPKLSLE